MVNDKILRESSGKYYSDTSKLGENLMSKMLQEVSEFCKLDAQQRWTVQLHQQVIHTTRYEVCILILTPQLIYEESGTIQLITLKPRSQTQAVQSQEENVKLRFLGITIPSEKYV